MTNFQGQMFRGVVVLVLMCQTETYYFHNHDNRTKQQVLLQ